ncbi:MAG: 2-hydroxyacyl-CoA dehydratase [Armatimonadetes bacterium]|jgi:benzoyl-CoA reductase/2-hydroxyglutaryl-CoA dehydratase subunit BcrC/BadD/HgdB|nr:2-hydroxyacyl-CoA dehydratase [Armatimonadota bacterium]
MKLADYTELWQSLGLDLEAHDGLLRTLGQAYKEIYLSQKNRPAGMDYFDFVISEIHGLRIRELAEARKEGRMVVGTFCLYVPEELVLALDGIAVGLCAGADVGTEAAEQVLPRNTCALIKSFFGFKLSGLCPYTEVCNLVIGETTCDGKTKAYELFNEYKPTFVIEVPRMKSPAARALWRSELGRLAAKLEELSGQPLTAEKLSAAVRTVNAKRAALHRLNALRQADPAPISGRDALLINQVQFYDDPVRFTEKVNALCDELEERVRQGVGVAPAGTPRVLVSGCPMAAPNWKLPFVVESSGAVIVGEESCVGERGTRHLVSEEGSTVDDILDRLAARYLEIDCAVFTPNTERLDHITEMAKTYAADGVIHYALQFCAPYTIEAARVERALAAQEVPLLRIETDYSMEDMPQLQTRVQAFLEMVRA